MRCAHSNIHWLHDPSHQIPEICGGKATILNRLNARYTVPPGFCVTAQNTEETISQAYQTLGNILGLIEPAVAVRSSAVGEDGQLLSFAGQYTTYLNISGINSLLIAINHCLASSTSERIAAYRTHFGQTTTPTVSVLVQQLIPAECSAVAFSINPVNGKTDEIIINAHWGLGESIAAGRVTPDTYLYNKEKNRLTYQHIGAKSMLTCPAPHGNGCLEIPTPTVLAAAAALNPGQLAAIIRMTLDLEWFFGYPVDIECAWHQNTMYLLQCRPITPCST